VRIAISSVDDVDITTVNDVEMYVRDVDITTVNDGDISV
jgi:hypothetical protein